MNIAQQIESIISQRKELLPQIENAQQRLTEAVGIVRRLEAFRDSVDLDNEPELANLLANLSTIEFNRLAQEAEKSLDTLKTRFGRNEINISFVGRAGQGKSLVLQKISGLNGNVIPSADGSDCTGARSVISNDPQSGKTTAQITFFSEAELVAIVNKYLETILGSNQQQVGSLAGISAINVSDIKTRIPPEQEIRRNLLSHLEKYVLHADELRSLLGKTITVGEKEIEQYVAQYKSDDKNQKYFNYLAVKEAIIKSPFPYPDAGKIVLVDTIGTGATSLGVEEDMLATAKNASDAIVVMKRPEPLRPRLTREDYELLEKIREELGAEYTKRLLFWVFNRVESGKGANSESIPELMNQMQKEGLAVAKYVNADCSKEKEVREKLLIPLLSQMSAHLAETDAFLVKGVNDQLEKCQKAFSSIGLGLDKALGASVTTDEHRYFYDDITRTIAALTNALRDLYIALNRKKADACEQLQEAAREKLKRVLVSSPSNEKILEKLNDGRLSQHDVLAFFTDELRLKIINEFRDLDAVLNEFVREAKCRIIDILMGDQGGKLANVVAMDGSDPDLWLDKLRDIISEDEYPLINNALRTLRDFDLSVENFLIYKVRSCLEPIDWSLRKQPPQLVNTHEDKDALVEEIKFILEDLLESVHTQIRNQLKNYYSFPNEAVFAVTRDFHDRIAGASENEATGLSASREWEYAYKNLIPIIWREERIKFGNKSSARTRWNELSTAISEYGRGNFLKIS